LCELNLPADGRLPADFSFAQAKWPNPGTRLRGLSPVLHPRNAPGKTRGVHPVTSTYTSYNLIARDLPAQSSGFASQLPDCPESEYYLERISEIKSIDGIHGGHARVQLRHEGALALKDMNYAKAFMRKGYGRRLETHDAFATKLADSIPREFSPRPTILPVK